MQNSDTVRGLELLVVGLVGGRLSRQVVVIHLLVITGSAEATPLGRPVGVHGEATAATAARRALTVKRERQERGGVGVRQGHPNLAGGVVGGGEAAAEGSAAD